jgi:HK97 family phage major capsid protein
MPYNDVVTRTEAGPLIPEEVTAEIFRGMVERSAVQQIARQLPNMSRKQQRMRVLDQLASAYFVAGEAGADRWKQTTKVAWENKFLVAEELAAIVPVHNEVLEDAEGDFWPLVRESLTEAMGLAFDAAVFFGTNAPVAWPTEIVTAAQSAGNEVVVGSLGSGTDLYDEILGEGGVFSKVEEDGYQVTGAIGAMALRSRLRGLRGSDGQPVFLPNMQDPTKYILDGNPIVFPRNGSVDASEVLMLAGDWSQVVWCFRQDITWEFANQAVIQDPSTGEIIHNFFQQDMTGIRAVMRIAWQVPNPVNRLQGTEANRYPIAVLVPAGS